MNEAPDTLVGMIDALVEPGAPEPVSLIPQTWGWAALALAVLVAAIWLIHRAAARRRANAYRRAARTALEAAQTASDVATILRRTALAAYPRAQVAGVIGADWIAFLSRTGKGDIPAQELTFAPYAAPDAAPSPALRRAAIRWVETHDGGS